MHEAGLSVEEMLGADLSALTNNNRRVENRNYVRYIGLFRWQKGEESRRRINDSGTNRRCQCKGVALGSELVPFSEQESARVITIETNPLLSKMELPIKIGYTLLC